MASIARKDVEILVHTTAPSRGQDDARYRGLAQAYLDFQPAKRRRLVGDSKEKGIVASELQLQGGLRHSTHEARESPEFFRPDEQSSTGEDVYEYDVFKCSQPLNSPDMSFNSAANNADSPVFHARVFGYDDTPGGDQSRQDEVADSWHTPPSEVADSQPQPSNPMSAFSSPTRMLELYLQNQESQGSRTTSDLNSPAKARQSSSLELPAGIGGGPSLSPQRSRNKPSSLEVPVWARGQSKSPENHRHSSSSVEFLAERRVEIPLSSTQSQNPTSSLDFAVVSKGGVQIPCERTSSLDLPTGGRRGPSSSPHAFTQSSPSPVKGPVRRSTRTLAAKNDIPPSTQDPALDSKRKWASSSSGEPRLSSAPPGVALPPVQHASLPQTPSARIRKRPRVEPSTPRTLESSEPISSPSKPLTSAISSNLSGPLVWNEKLEVRPRPPATSTGTLTADMLITPALANLKNKMPEPRDPVFHKRVLREFERGYWLVDCRNWDEGRRNRCWEELGDFIGNGHAGWGVWLTRDAQFHTFRIYSFGYVAGHVYLLLYMASRSKIGKAGICWKGGDGETIIQMPS